ncbi:hypothetical protein HNQ91_004903 [Filimonas zeae]|uniref:Exo-alpha-sialidase n=1 Tax=Filimonas zeae TaxID=1737353 RepID=A0A917J4J4_9BACT|nr:hypothetical protein [Filimonas zeae]MDR6341826.1 hypothetical protein [Filimonas zeae]GGH80184.1 hypothetical protein GCM10011379_50680 [Filimonas zeae]
MRALLVFVLAASTVLYSCRKSQTPKSNELDEPVDTTTYFYTPVSIGKGVVAGSVYKTNEFAAFTDLTFFDKAWFIVYRVGSNHVGGTDGVIKILKSTDTKTWQVDKTIALNGLDLRDPKLEIDTYSNKLYLTFFSSEKTGKKLNYICEYKRAHQWTVPEQMSSETDKGLNFLLWRLTYYKNKMFSVGYRFPISNDSTYKGGIELFESTKDFKQYKSLGNLEMAGVPTEATVRFDENSIMYCISRTEKKNSPMGIAYPPYQKMRWIEEAFLTRISSPNFLLYKKHFLITGRDGRTGILKFISYDPKASKVEKVFSFPFAGKETGYAGMCFNPSNPNELLISYYSIEANGSSIFLARIDLSQFL